MPINTVLLVEALPRHCTPTSKGCTDERRDVMKQKQRVSESKTTTRDWHHAITIHITIHLSNDASETVVA
jgi:hypothetical protein